MKRHARDEQGSVTTFVVVFTVALLFVAGLVIDGGFVLNARRQAIVEAEAAARAGAQMIEPTGQPGANAIIDTFAAEQAVNSYLATTGHSGTTAVDGDTVSVEVSYSRPMSILGLGGLWSVTVHGHGSADATTGILQQGDL